MFGITLWLESEPWLGLVVTGASGDPVRGYDQFREADRVAANDGAAIPSVRENRERQRHPLFRLKGNHTGDLRSRECVPEVGSLLRRQTWW